MSNDSIPPGQREFRCEHCHGKILIPVDFPPTTGPCPHCAQVVTSPPPESPLPVAPAPPVEPTPVPVERTPAPVEPTPAPVEPTPAPVERRMPPVNPVERPVKPESVAGPEPKAAPVAAPVAEPTADGGKRSIRTAVVIVLTLLLLGGWTAFFLLNPGSMEAPPAMKGSPSPEMQEAYYLDKGWEADAREVLANFLAADTPMERARYSIRGDELLPEMEEFYAERSMDDSDTPAEAFSVYQLPIEDRKRGIFMLVYDQPPAFEMSEFFVPVVPLAVQYKVEEPDLLAATLGRAGNFASEPIKVQALFKRTSEGLKVDWEAFVQSKHRKFRDFLELPESGKTEVFRVLVVETVPENREVPAGHRVYLVIDPAYRNEDMARTVVPVDSEIGRALSILNWRGTNGGRATVRSATLELGWSDEATPQLEIERFICWEFLGVGGEALPGGGARNGGE